MSDRLWRPSHDSLHKSRLKKHSDRAVCNAERVYLAEWKRFNHGTDDKLALILWSDELRQKKSWPPQPTERDRAVAASVIQWLATVVGHGFLLGCERKVGRGDFEAQRRYDAQLSALLIQGEHATRRRHRMQDWVARQRAREQRRQAEYNKRLAETARREGEREEHRKRTQRAIQLR